MEDYTKPLGILLAFGKHFQLISSIVLGELVALREGLQIAKDMKLAHLEVFRLAIGTASSH